MMFILDTKEDTSIPFSTEDFIKKWLKNNNGTFATYMKDTKSEDEDFVKGREALSETLGLWMEYALEKDDQALFEDSYVQLTELYLEKDGFIYWKLTESGEQDVHANALVDDLRMIYALFQASDKWNVSAYEQTARHISTFTIDHNVYEHVLTDYYEKEYNGTSSKVTLSYIEPNALVSLVDQQLLPEDIYINTINLLDNAPTTLSFFPKGYDVEKRQYYYDETVNMVDQALVAIYRARRDVSTGKFQDFIEKELTTNDAVYGQYNIDTGNPIVNYESPALYRLLIMYYLELNKISVANELYDKMVEFKSGSDKYSGGYGIYQKNTHIFDNIIPLLAERKMHQIDLIE